MRARLTVAALAAACAAEPGGSQALGGLWLAGPHDLPASVVRASSADLSIARVRAQGLALAVDGDAVRWCLRAVREGASPTDAEDPCGCTPGSRDTDCLAGTLTAETALPPDVVVGVTLSPDGAGVARVGTLWWTRHPDGDRLALAVGPLTEPLRRTDVSTGLQGPLWSGADDVGWYTRVEGGQGVMGSGRSRHSPSLEMNTSKLHSRPSTSPEARRSK